MLPKTNRASASTVIDSQKGPDVIYQKNPENTTVAETVTQECLDINPEIGSLQNSDEDRGDTPATDCFVAHTNNIDCRKYDKKFVCLFCGNWRSKLPDHLKAKHDEEEEVIRYMEEKDPSEQEKIYIKIRNLGNHLHNVRVLRKREGHLIVKYRPSGESANADLYGPCPFCYGYYIRRELWRHKCPLKPKEVDNSRSKLAVTSMLLLPQSSIQGPLLQKVVCTMKTDQISRVAKSDETIIQLGEKLCNKHGHDSDKYNYVRQKMREMARLVMELRKTTQLPNSSLASFFHPKYYRILVTCSRIVSGFDESSNRYGTPSLALKIGHSLQKCLKIVIGNCIERRDKCKEQEVEELQKLVDMNWTDDVSSNALKTLQEEKRNRRNILPIADDVKIFSEHLKTTAEEQFKMVDEMKDSKVPVNAWKKLSGIVLAQLILFNRRRSGEVSRMKVSEYMSKQTADEGSQFESILTGFEKKLCFIMPRVEIDGKRGRTVAVLFPQHIIRNLDLLLQTRSLVLTNENPYLFPTVYYGSVSHIRGSDCLRKLAAECGATAPERLRSTNLRKHMATMSQVLNLKEHELDILANFMGHDIRVHREFYRLPEATVQVAKVAKLLLTMENGGKKLPAGQSLDDIQLDDETILEDGTCVICSFSKLLSRIIIWYFARSSTLLLTITVCLF